MPEISVWASLGLMVLAATVVEQATQFAARRGWVAASTAVWTAFVATTVLGTALVLAATLQGQSWFYFILVAGAAVATGVSVWQREWVWLPTAGRLFSTAAVTALGGVNDDPGRAMGLVVLSLSFFTFAPLARRLPRHFRRASLGGDDLVHGTRGCPARLRLRRAVGRPRAGCGRLP